GVRTRRGPGRLDDLGPQHERPHLAGVAAALGALGDDDVDARVAVAAGLLGRAAQSRQRAPAVLDLGDNVGRRRAQGVGDQAHAVVPQRHLDLGSGGRTGPSQQLAARLLALRQVGYAVVSKELAGEVDVALGHHGPQLLGQLLRVLLDALALVLAGDDHVDAVRVLADVLVDPVELDGELFGREADGPEHAEPTRLADGGDHVAAV